MLALTLIQPWATAILCMSKDVENRTWAPSEATLPIGTRFAIHAGAKLDRNAAIALLRDIDLADPLPEMPKGVLMGTVELAAIVRVTEERTPLLGTGMVQTSRSAELIGDQALAKAALDSRWANPEATILWVLRNPRVLPTPIPCKGALGLWRVPPEHVPALEALGRAA